jgi:hypothetical protein
LELEAILRGPSRRISPARRSELSAWLRRETRAPSKFPPPLYYAHLLELHVREHGPDDSPGAFFSPGVVIYGCGSTRRCRGFVAYAAVASAVLSRNDEQLLPEDIWLLACEIAVPAAWVKTVSFPLLVLLQRYIPEWALEAWLLRVMRGH